MAFAQAPEPEGYVRLFLDEGAPMLSLLRDVSVHHGVASEHARRLLSFAVSPAAVAPDRGQRRRGIIGR